MTIDGADARDFDDAVWAEPDADAKNPGGWHMLVAIADVAWYVRAGSALDGEARGRGNSVYFPRSGRSHAARDPVERLVLAQAERGPPLPRRPPVDRQRWQSQAPSLRQGHHALGRPPHLRPGAGRPRRRARPGDQAPYPGHCRPPLWGLPVPGGGPEEARNPRDRTARTPDHA